MARTTLRTAVNVRYDLRVADDKDESNLYMKARVKVRVELYLWKDTMSSARTYTI